MSGFPKRPWFYRFGNWAMRLIFRIILRVHLRGLENIPATGSAIIGISHSSFVDPLIAGAYSPRDVVPMAKAEVFESPGLGWIVQNYGAFPVRRGEVDLKAMKTALKVLHSGYLLVIAPEGHRSESGALQQGREGAIILSLRSGAPILPVAVWGGKQLWKNLTRFRKTDIWYYVGAPVIPAIAPKPTREQVAAMSDELMLLIADMMPAEIRGYYTGWSMPAERLLKPFQPKEVANVN